MEFLTNAADSRVVGFASRADEPLATLVHVHGYGGDAYSNRFVREMHARFPARGISFVSCVLSTSGYIGEDYFDGSVEYTGSALIDPEQAVQEVLGTCGLLGWPEQLVLQGHSFGTNIVRTCLELDPTISAAIFLAPADSLALQQAYEKNRVSRPLSGLNPDSITWDQMGIRVDGMDYSIPVQEQLFSRLVVGRVFNAWSDQTFESMSSAECLVVQGAADPISRFGRTRNKASFVPLLPRSELRLIEGASHSFLGAELELIAIVANWLEVLGLARASDGSGAS